MPVCRKLSSDYTMAGALADRRELCPGSRDLTKTKDKLLSAQRALSASLSRLEALWLCCLLSHPVAQHRSHRAFWRALIADTAPHVHRTVATGPCRSHTAWITRSPLGRWKA